MLTFDQESGRPLRSGYGLSGPAGTPGRSLGEIAREIERAQREQTETMAHIVERLKVAETARPGPARSRPHSRPRKYMLLDEAGDEPWDIDAAEELMQGHEAVLTEPDRRVSPPAMSSTQQAWIGERFNDVTQRITQALSDLRPGPAVAALEERIDAFQAHLGQTLQDVARRSDLEGMRLIEVHVNDLGDKLSELERHVVRIDGIESDVRAVMAQVSDDRLAKLFNADNRFAVDLEAVARRAAEDVHVRLGGETAHLVDRHDALRQLVEASIADRREAEAHAVSLVTTLSGRVNAQSDRYDEIRGLLEQAIAEQRQNEQTAFAMLETLQQALAAVLDRMDAMERQQQPSQRVEQAAAAEPAPAPVPVPVPVSQEPILGPPPPDAPSLEAPVAAPEPSTPGDAPYTFRDTHFDSIGAPEPVAPAEAPAAVADAAGPVEPAAAEEPESPLDRLRRDFIAEARRAKLKAAANRAEALDETADAPALTSIADMRDSLFQPKAPEAGSGRLFGMSTKLLAAVLVLIIAINGSLLLLNRKSAPRPVVPQISYPAATEPDGGAAHPADETPGSEPHANPGHDRTGEAAPIPYGFHDDVPTPPEVAPVDGGSTSEAPQGMTISRSAATLSEAAAAGVYEQQMFASLSGQLGMIAAGQSASALLPDVNGRISAAYPAPDLDPAGEAETSHVPRDLPPATVGPMSLRVAAANGDPSAEFEVAARLAEGRGTGQDYAEALRWYQRSAAKGFAQAQYRVGTLYERGLGVAKDLERAKIWYQRAAEGGNVKSMHNLAVLTAGGARPNYAAALPWFLKAAEHGLPDSQYNLGVLVENGLGIEADRVEAYKWYALAAKSGDGEAIERRDAVISTLTAEELAIAEERIAGYRALPASPLANDARAAGEDWKKRVNNDTNT